MTTVTYDRTCFKLNNIPVLLLSGSAHYPRLHPSRWQTLFQTYHAAHLNTLETYVFWNEHEPPPSPLASTPAQYNFHGRRDLFAFLHAAHQANLYVVLRIGPYVCAEASYGGFPARLRDVPQIQFRTWNQPFMNQVETWVRYIATRLKDERLLAPLGGPVIMTQLENEYQMVSDGYGNEGAKYLQWVADLQKELDLGVPGIMCYGAAEGVVETINAFYAHTQLENHWNRHEDQPAFWTECWTGWYDVWGAKHHNRHVTDLAYAVCRFFAQGGGGINYYMWMGGTNWGRGGMYLQATSYDYDAPVNEVYGETTKMRVLARLHGVLKDIWQEGREAAKERENREGMEIWKWQGGVEFVCDDVQKRVKIVKHGDLLFDSGVIEDSDVVEWKMEKVESAMIGEWSRCREEIPTVQTIEEIAARSGREVVRGEKAAEQIGLTKDGSDYCWYCTQVKVDGKRILEFEAGDFVYVFVNGEMQGMSDAPLWEDRWSNRWNFYEKDKGRAQAIEIEGDGIVDLGILCVSMGLVKGEWQLGGGENLLDERKGILSDVGGVERVCEWYCMPFLNGEVGHVNDGESGVPGWMWCKMRLEKVGERMYVDLGDVGKGMLYVNGELVGRFWNCHRERGMNGFLKGSPIEQEEKEEGVRFYHVPQWMLGDEDAVEVKLFVEYGQVPDRLQWQSYEMR